MLKIYNSLKRKEVAFTPINHNEVGMYACGPTVYDYAHIGHGRKYVMDDMIKRSLTYMGYKVKHVMNITDVGHMVSDSDEGEDKLEKGAKKAGKTVWEVAEFFTEDFNQMLTMLNIIPANVVCKATDHIDEQIAQIQQLFANGYAYDTLEAVYFDTSKFEGYNEIFGQKLEEKIIGARDEVKTDTSKRNPQDFVLWFKRVGKYQDHVMHWESPWGDGFPGWHIECSAMSIKYLGEQFDIHTGGVDHLSIHHPNEIAQAEGATGKKPFVKYWIHHDHLMVEGQKMSKSIGNVYRAVDLKERGYDPIILRLFYYSALYLKSMNFTWDALNSAKTSYNKLLTYVRDLYRESKGEKFNDLKINKEFKNKFIDALKDGFNTPVALSVVWEMLKSDLDPASKLATLLDFDRVLGLKLEERLEDPEEPGTEEIKKLLAEREEARKEKDYPRADAIRERLKNEYGFEVKDGR